MNLLSLGAGVQSSTLLLMALAGELEQDFGRLDGAIFADTGWEPAAVYAHLDKLETAMKTPGVPLYRVSRGNIKTDALDPHRRKASMPMHVKNLNGSNGKMRRQCTSDYKIDVIQKQVRACLGLRYRQRAPKNPVVTQWIGISTDEAHRMKDSRLPYIVHRWPLIELGMNRLDCHRWLAAHGWDAPKSSCIGCPFHSIAHWRHMQATAPSEFEEACQFDEALRAGHVKIGKAGLRGQAFLSRQLIPLRTVDLRSERDHGQLDMFGEECTGICGV